MPILITRNNYRDGDTVTAAMLNSNFVKDITGAFPIDASTPLLGSLIVTGGTAQSPSVRFPGSSIAGFYYDGPNTRTVWIGDFFASGKLNVGGDLQAGGKLTIGGNLQANGNATIEGPLTVNGATTLTSLNTSGNTTVGGYLSVLGMLKVAEIDPSFFIPLLTGNNGTTLKAFIVNLIYPVGSIYTTTNPANPASYLGSGTWQAWGSGRIPVGVDAADTDFNTVEKTGGAKNTTLSIENLPAHTHSISQQTLSISESGIHKHALFALSYTENYSIGEVHSFKNAVGGNAAVTGRGFDPDTVKSYVTNNSNGTQIVQDSGSHTHTATFPGANTSSVGSATPFKNLQPYITLYMWKRIA